MMCFHNNVYRKGIQHTVLTMTVLSKGSRALIINFENLVKILEKNIINHCKPIRNRG